MDTIVVSEDEKAIIERMTGPRPACPACGGIILPALRSGSLSTAQWIWMGGGTFQLHCASCTALIRHGFKQVPHA